MSAQRTSKKLKSRAASRIPARAVKIAKELGQLPGVVCVVWGSRRKGKRWFHEEPCLSVHVKRKLSKRTLSKRTLRDQFIAPEIDGYRVDVLEVGTPKHHALGVGSRVDAGALGKSTATVFATRGQDAVAIVSGHATLAGGAGEISMNANGQDFEGTLDAGDFGKGLSVDFALATFRGAAGDTDTSHPLLNGQAPFRLGQNLIGGDSLKHFSVKRGTVVPGVFQGTVINEITLEGDTYTSLLSIASKTADVPFSLPGDSGSLVVDGDGSAAAAIVGGRPAAHVFYAYDLRRLSSMLSATKLGLFFEED